VTRHDFVVLVGLCSNGYIHIHEFDIAKVVEVTATALPTNIVLPLTRSTSQ
jgi:hypothetical protein